MTALTRAATRAEELGFLGASLLSRLSLSRLSAVHTPAPDFHSQLVQLDRIARVDVVTAIAYSLLRCDYPVQVRFDTPALLWMAAHTYSDLPTPCPRRAACDTFSNTAWRKSHLRLKAHPGATNKVNLYFSEVWSALTTLAPTFATDALTYCPYFERLFDDQASAVLLYAYGIRDVLPHPFPFALASVLSPQAAKQFSTALKALGYNASDAGSKLVESNTLAGRAVGRVDLFREASLRCDPAHVAASVTHTDPTALRAAIRAILAEELGTQHITWPAPADKWLARWAWCVNGSHSHNIEQVRPEYKVTHHPAFSRWYRRMYAEALARDPLSDWDGTTTISASEKLEHGKTRVIFACDSVSYFNFEYLMAPIERAWRNKRVVIDPGAGGHTGMIDRVRALWEGGSLNLMLDFDDFNSQHSTESMQAVFEELCWHTGCPDDLRERIVGSFDRMYMMWRGRRIGHLAGTLMSGHRCTTFINSVLNAAYIRCAIGPDLYARARAIHTGDDVYMNLDSHDELAAVLDAVRASDLRLNPMKQSCGTYSAEFLRVAIIKEASFGYLARSVASVVSGNWVHDIRLSASEGLQTLLTNSRTLINRSRMLDIYRLLIPSAQRITQLSRRALCAVLSGDVAVGDGPAFRSTGYLRYVSVVIPPRFDPHLPDSVPDTATTDYLSYKATPVERRAMLITGTNLYSDMLLSSYRTALVRDVDVRTSITLSRTLARPIRQSYTVRELKGTEPRSGLFSGLPLMNLMRDTLRDAEIRDLLAFAGVQEHPPDAYVAAFGPRPIGGVINGWLSYTDACHFARLSRGGIVYASTPSYV